ncbi:MAG: thiamine pyrophosphate-dependent enzyme [Thermoplasmatota archaeon]
MDEKDASITDTYIRKEMWPTIFCAGCGNGILLGNTFQALENLRIDLDDVVFVSGIGCSSRLPGYINADGLHTTHGRAIAFATGIKAVNPDLHVIVYTGDGDCAGIGGNHFMHGARRNIDITVIMVNNFNYGMTGGQFAPTTPRFSSTSTSPYGNIEHPFDMCKLAIAIGAPFVARCLASKPVDTVETIMKGMKKKGFSFIEFLSPCVTNYGRRNKMGSITKLWKWYDDHTISITKYNHLMEEGTALEKEQLQSLMQIGVFQDIEKPEFFMEYQNILQKLYETD